MSDATDLYLSLLKLCLTNFIHGDVEEKLAHSRQRLKQRIVETVAARGIRMVRPAPFDPELRREGKDWPPTAETMIGLKRLNNLQFCIEDVLSQRVPGDLIET